MASILKSIKGPAGREGFLVFCPGCDIYHQFNTAGVEPVWSFNGDLENPTFTPSLRVRYTHEGGEMCCHSFVRDGQWQFLNDCTHDLAGQTVPMVVVP